MFSYSCRRSFFAFIRSGWPRQTLPLPSLASSAKQSLPEILIE
ncbi:unnamed protein product [Rhodiola kirilowii]